MPRLELILFVFAFLSTPVFAEVTVVAPGPAGLAVFETLSLRAINSPDGFAADADVPPGLLTTNAVLFATAGSPFSRNVGIAVVNPGDASAVVTMSIRTLDGTVISRKAIPLFPHHQTTSFIREVFPDLGETLTDFNGSLGITSDNPIAISAMRFQGIRATRLPVESLSGSSGAGNSVWAIFPQLATGEGWTSKIAMINTTASPMTVRVDLFQQDGAPIPGHSFTNLIPSHGLFIQDYPASDGPLQEGYAIVTVVDAPATATAPHLTKPEQAGLGAFETFSFQTGDARQSLATEADIPPAIVTTEAVVFATASSPTLRNLGIAIVNPGNAPALLTTLIRRADGTLLSSKTLSLSGRQQTSQFVTELFSDVTELLADFNGSLVVTADHPVAIAAMRFQGSNMAAVPIESLSPGIGNSASLIFPQFASGEGWASRFVMLNTASLPMTVRVDLFQPDGTVLRAQSSKQAGLNVIPRGGALIWDYPNDAGPIQEGYAFVTVMDTLAPAVSATIPLLGATGVAINKKIDVTFSETLDPSTINTTTFLIVQGSTPVAGTVTYVGMTATFSPASPLAPNTAYTGIILTEVTDLAGNQLTSNYVWSFATGSALDTTPPAVSLTDPANGVSGVPINAKISATFSEELDPSTVNTITFTLKQGSTPVPGTVSYTGTTAIFSPAAPLAPNTTFTATIAGIKDLAGNVLAAPYLWSFATGTNSSSTPPAVSSTTPATGATGVAVNMKIEAVFTRELDPLTATTVMFTLKQGTIPVAGTVSYSGTTATFSPALPLAANTTYTATILAGVKDLLGNALADNYAWIFTTGAAPDTTPPAVSSTLPANAATGVGINTKIDAIFSEAIDVLTINTATFPMKQGSTPVPGTVALVGTTATFSPTVPLTPNTTYTATIVGGIKDLLGNALPGNYVWSFTTGDAPDTTPPAVSSTDPANGTIAVPINTKVNALFTEQLDPLTINSATFLLKQGIVPVAGTVTLSGTTATLSPLAPLTPNTTFTATIAAGIKDLSGNALAGSYTWTFTTGAAPDTTPPAVTATDPASGAAGVAINSEIDATFTEELDPLTMNVGTFLLTQGATPESSIPVAGTVRYSGVTATFSPAAALAPNSVFTATITGIKDLKGNLLPSKYTWSFTTGAAPDTTPPSVSSTDPANGATGAGVNAKIEATFTEDLDPLTINAATFTLKQGTTPVAGTVTYAGGKATFSPIIPLAPTKTFTATISTGIKDLSGNALPSNYVWSFTTGAAPDMTPPAVSSTNPANGTTGVAVNTKIEAAFSEDLDPLTINVATFTLKQGTTSIVGTVSQNGETATLSPTTPLTPNTTYTATIAGGIKDLAGNALSSNYVWSFTTGAAPDTTPPAVTSTDPANGTTGVAINSKIDAIFTEELDPVTVNTATFLVKQGVTPVAGTVTYVNRTATFSPAVSLAPNTTFTASVLGGVKDLLGNSLSNNYVWSFTTGAVPDTTPPAVTSTDPANGAVGVGINMKIAASFTEELDPLTINTATFLLKQGNVPVAGTVSFAGRTATFSPSAPLVPNTTFTATILGGIKDLLGNALTSSYVWSFTTGAAPDTTPPSVSSTDPANGAASVGINMKVGATFSEDLDPLTINVATFTLKQGATSIAGTVSYLGRTATFSPLAPLAPNTTFTAAIAAGIKDLLGNALPNSYVWSFTTGAAPDTTPPAVSSTNPANGATGVAVNKKIDAIFTEELDLLTMNVSTFLLKEGLTPVVGTVTYVGTTATFSPGVPLAPNTTFTATISSGIKDLLGNALPSSYVWSFTTGAAPDTTPPAVSSTNPANGATAVGINTKVDAIFSEQLDPLTINSATFLLTQAGTPIAGTVAYVGTTATFSPLVSLVPNTIFTATIVGGIKDLAGNALGTNYIWSFTTGGVANTTPLAVSSTDPANETTGLATNRKVVVNFSEEVDAVTMNSATFTLNYGSAPVAGSVTCIGTTAIFTPSIALPANTTITATIVRGIKGLAGNSLASNYVWRFTTGSSADTTPPQVNSTDPTNGATGVPASRGN